MRVGFFVKIFFIWILVLLIEFTIVQLPSFAKCTRTWWQYLMGSFCIKSHAMIEFLTGISNPGILRKKVTVWKSNFRFACFFYLRNLGEQKWNPFLYFYCHHPEYLKKVISHYIILKGNARCISKVISTSVEVIKSMIYIRNIYLSK